LWWVMCCDGGMKVNEEEKGGRAVGMHVFWLSQRWQVRVSSGRATTADLDSFMSWYFIVM